MIKVQNDFHNTETYIRVDGYKFSRLTDGQIRYAKVQLCGAQGCTCSGIVGDRGPQGDVAGFSEEDTGVYVIPLDYEG